MKRLAACIVALTIILAFPFLTALAGDTCAVKHTVQTGENLYRIGLKYGVSWPAIAAANNISDPNRIAAGQVLCIPVAATATTAATPTKTSTPSTSATPTTTPATATSTKPPTTAVTPTATPTRTSTPIPASFVILTFTITGVVRDQAVTISAINFPRNTKFDVLMGAMHTQGVNGVFVAVTDSGSGAFTATYNIPASLKGSSQISIRLQSNVGYYSYNWFYNNSTK
ncbi:MAG: LysM peptidoglycan-binding domain-containing protein [Chloroflexi bacterium]|nr:LysM peptidoglycan-binding domain-containing protein [Chloroflexota bacterium]